MKKKVLIITYQDDNACIERVIKAIEESGGEGIRFDVDKYPMENLLTVSYENAEKKILLDNGTEVHDLTNIEGLWYRRMHDFAKCIIDALDVKYARPSWEESKTTLLGLLAGIGTDTFTMNTYSGVRHADAKEEQLRVASRLGLKTPRTLYYK